MEKFKAMFPILFSPKFWGIILTALAYWFSEYGFVFTAEAVSTFLLMISGTATVVGFADGIARKVGAKK